MSYQHGESSCKIGENAADGREKETERSGQGRKESVLSWQLGLNYRSTHLCNVPKTYCRAARSGLISLILESRVIFKFTALQCRLLQDRPGPNSHNSRTGSRIDKIISSRPAPFVVYLRWSGVYGWKLIFE